MHRGPRRAGAVALVLLIPLLAACSAPGPSDAGSPTDAPNSASSAAPLLLGPVGLAEVGGAVWVAWAASARVSEVDDAGAPGAVVDVDETPLRLATLGDSLWVTQFGVGTLAEVDPASGSVARTVEVGAEPEGIVALGDRLFVVLQASAELVEVDPGAGTVVRRYPVGGEPRQVATDGRALFVTDHGSGLIVRVVPGESAEITRSKAVCAGAQSVLVVRGTVRAACGEAGTVVSLDADTLALTGEVEVPGGPDGLAVAPDGALLVTLQVGPELVALPDDGGAPQTVASWTSGDLADRANVGLLVVGPSAYVSDPLADVVHVVAL